MGCRRVAAGVRRRRHGASRLGGYAVGPSGVPPAAGSLSCVCEAEKKQKYLGFW
jgi:hypothetical protein